MDQERLKNDLDRIPGLRRVIDRLEIASPLGRRLLSERRFSTDPQALAQGFSRQRVVEMSLDDPRFASLRVKLSQVKDLAPTLESVRSAARLDDPQLFEIKFFAILCEDLARETEQLGWTFVRWPNLTSVVEILDPNGYHTAAFYVYDRYSDTLRRLRAEAKLDPTRYEAVADEEAQVRFQLVKQLQPFVDALLEAQHVAGELDVLTAQCLMNRTLGLVEPELGTKTEYNGLFNPAVREALSAERKQFQPVNVEVIEAPTLIVGANMGGKSVLLKSVALAQALVQYGFRAPASKACVRLVAGIGISIGDGQDENRGLSSYAYEILAISRMLEAVRSGVKMLLLIDEPARTTNPTEGSALVEALVGELADKHVSSLITTHYAELSCRCRRLRVRGLRTVRPDETLSQANLQQFMDYSLTEVVDGDVPHEALNVATLLGADRELIEKAKILIEVKNAKK